jgi:hypothetical protein
LAGVVVTVTLSIAGARVAVTDQSSVQVEEIYDLNRVETASLNGGRIEVFSGN